MLGYAVIGNITNDLKPFAGSLVSFHTFAADFWIGLTDDSQEGVWEWLPSTETSGFADWAPGQPDNGHNEDCAVMAHYVNYHWNDDQCDNSHNFICEKE
jgi:hypothetical protein